ncbi:MAG: glycosyltransferase [Firmicutes bacterium]|nr:glycosyltransferase [Bacillota bacterium]
MLITYLILTYNRKHDLDRCLKSIQEQRYSEIEVIVVDNNSTDGTDQFIDAFYPSVHYIYVDYNSGVCEGRNIGFRQATGDVIIVLDDDSEVNDPNFTDSIVKQFISNNSMGLLSFKVTNPLIPDTRRVIPSTDKSIINSMQPVEVAYFLGGGVAIRKKVLDETGLYPSQYFYSMEELDLAYRVMKTQWKIFYFPKIEVLHHESQNQRPSWRRFYFDCRNRVWLTVTYLPLKYLLINNSVWFFKMLLQAVKYRHTKHFFRGFCDGIKGLPFFLKRRKNSLLTKEEVKRIRLLHGRLYY